MPNINKIRLSGTTYTVQDENACKVVELTQAEYDALPASAKTSNSLFVITDATAGDLSNYYTKSETDGLLDTKLDVTAYTPTDLSNYYTKSETSGATEISTALASKADTATTYTKTETDNAITAATSTKQDTLVSGTNIKTINGETLLGEGNIDIQGGGGGSITIDQSLDSSSTNPVANSAITNALHETYFYNLSKQSDHKPETKFSLLWKYIDTKQTTSHNPSFVIAGINGTKIASLGGNPDRTNFELVETSAITTSVTSSSTDAQVPSAKAVYDMVGNINTILESI